MQINKVMSKNTNTWINLFVTMKKYGAWIKLFYVKLIEVKFQKPKNLIPYVSYYKLSKTYRIYKSSLLVIFYTKKN